MESARTADKTGRFSIIAGDPFLIFSSKGRRVTLTDYRGTRESEADPFDYLKNLLERYRYKHPRMNDAPFSGGAIGMVSYEAKNLLEATSHTRAVIDDLGVPDLYFIFTDTGFLWDHEKKQVWRFDPGKRKPIPCRAFHKTLSNKPLRIEAAVSRQEFMRRVLKAKEYIHRGDIFQANLSQRFSFPLHGPVAETYAKLKAINPSPFFGILDAKDFQIVSGSPERLVELKSGELSTRPIAGTRSKLGSLAQDRRQTVELLLSEKERAEHIMLVDLERNDLGRVAETGSVVVDELMAIEEYSHVKHIVSNVRARLRKDLSAVDALKAMFPGGTITGAPKIRSMQIIDELEGVARGPYTGSMGYFSFTGDMDFNIIIRSLLIKSGTAYLSAGAGIVADSDPSKEYDETLYKAEAVFTALFGRLKTQRLFQRLRAGR